MHMMVAWSPKALASANVCSRRRSRFVRTKESRPEKLYKEIMWSQRFTPAPLHPIGTAPRIHRCVFRRAEAWVVKAGRTKGNPGQLIIPTPPCLPTPEAWRATRPPERLNVTGGQGNPQRQLLLSPVICFVSSCWPLSVNRVSCKTKRSAACSSSFLCTFQLLTFKLSSVTLEGKAGFWWFSRLSTELLVELVGSSGWSTRITWEIRDWLETGLGKTTSKWSFILKARDSTAPTFPNLSGGSVGRKTVTWRWYNSQKALMHSSSP